MGIEYLVIVMGFLVLASGFFAFRRWREAQTEIVLRQQAQEALSKLHDELEARVQERTAELAKTTHSLQAEIAERNRAQTALEQSESQFRALFEFSPDAIVLIDPHAANASWPIVDCNVAAGRMNGYARDEMIGQSIDILNLAPGTPAERNAYLKNLRQAGTINLETQHRRKNGDVFPVEVFTTLITVGERELIMGIDRDITERKQAEEAFTRERNFLRTVIDNMPDQIFVKDRQGRFLIANQAVVQSRGVASEADLLGKTDFDLFPREQAHDYQTIEQAVMEAGEPINNQPESYTVSRTGTRHWILTTKVPLRDERGQVIGLVGLIRDISELKQAEQTLRDSEEYYRLMFESNPLPMWVFDTDTLAFLSVNEAAIANYGYSREQFLSMTIKDIRPAEDVAQLVGTVAQPNAGGRNGGVWRHRKRDGSIIDVEMFTHDVKFADRPARLALANDVTARQQHERELEAIAVLSAALRTAQTRAEMLPVVLDELLGLFGAEAAALDFGDPVTGESLTELGRGLWTGLSGQYTPSGDGITAQVLTTGQVYQNNDIQTDPRFTQAALVGGIRAVACAPLTADQRKIGALWIGRRAPFHPAEVRLLKSIADMAANAIQRASLHEATERHLQQLAALREIDQAIASSLDLKFSLNVLLEQVTRQLGVDAADVLIYLPALHRLDYAAGRGFRTGAIEKVSLRLGEGHAGRAALERRVQHISNIPALGREPGTASLVAPEGFVEYYGTPLIAKGNVLGVLELFHRHPIQQDANWLEFLSAVAGQAAIAIDNIHLFEGLERSNVELALAYDATIEGWSHALDLRDKETEGHSQRVTELTLQLAEAMGVGEPELVPIRRGALLHDIGKMGVPDAILLKPGTLSDEEFALMKRHPALAYDMLSPIGYLQPALDIPYCHHEKWDGSGYPRGLKGEQIPLAARIFAVADVWDALRSDRPYRPAWPEDKVREHIRALAGTHFDPKVMEVFLSLV